MNVWIDDLEKALSDPDRVYNLDLSKKGLDTIPDYLGRFPNLISLKLSYNNLDSLNESLSTLSKLEFLDLSGNKIRKMNWQYLSRMKYSLRELWLRDNDLEELSSDINVLESLEVLNIGNNNIRHIDDDISLSRLRELVLDDNELRTVPKLIHESSRLSGLNVNGNQIDSFRLTENDKNLIELNIGNNPLIDFNVEPGNYRLEVLVFDWIKIEEGWMEEFPPTLIVLSMEHCDLESIEKISHLRRLEQLSIIANQIQTIDGVVGKLKRLNKIWIGKNRISAEEILELEKRYVVVY